MKFEPTYELSSFIIDPDHKLQISYLKDQQENMKFTIICHLAAFFVSGYFIKKKAAK